MMIALMSMLLAASDAHFESWGIFKKFPFFTGPEVSL